MQLKGVESTVSYPAGPGGATAAKRILVQWRPKLGIWHSALGWGLCEMGEWIEYYKFT